MVLDCNLCYAGICNRLAFFVPRQLSSTARAVCMPGYNARAKRYRSRAAPSPGKSQYQAVRTQCTKCVAFEV